MEAVFVPDLRALSRGDDGAITAGVAIVTDCYFSRWYLKITNSNPTPHPQLEICNPKEFNV